MLNSKERVLLEKAQNALSAALDAVQEFGEILARGPGDSIRRDFLATVDTARCRLEQAKDKVQCVADMEEEGEERGEDYRNVPPPDGGPHDAA